MMRKSSGLTLVETMLALAIVLLIIILSIRQVQMYRRDSYYATIKYNVDVLFDGMKQYYQTNCSKPGPGGFWPTTYSPVITQYSAISPYLIPAWPIYSPIVNADASGGTINSYYGQFNPLPQVKKNQYACFNFGSLSCTNTVEIPNTVVVIWQSQVVVQMAEFAVPTAGAYVGIVGATCATNEFASGDIVDCSNPSNVGLVSGKYLVWQRLPSFPSAATNSEHWVANPTATLFKQQYTNDPMYEMYNPSAQPNATNQTYYMNYLCGG